jgi:ubiquinone biosynthesis protein COQ4
MVVPSGFARISIMTPAAAPDTRMRPLDAARAMRALLRDKEDTRQVFLLMDALRGKTTIRQLAKFRKTAIGQRILAERRQLLDRLNDRAGLAQLPAGSLGRAYHEFMAAENLSADGLVEASQVLRRGVGDELTLFRERNREMHDLLHIVTGYGRDPVGEACVVAFSYAQTGHVGFAVIAFFGALNIAKKLPGQPVKRAVWEAYRRGAKAKWLVGADWETLLSLPVEAIRAQFNVRPMRAYPQIIAAVGDKLAQPQPVAMAA